MPRTTHLYYLYGVGCGLLGAGGFLSFPRGLEPYQFAIIGALLMAAVLAWTLYESRWRPPAADGGGA